MAIKKEDGLYYKGGIFKKKGALVLTSSDLSFLSKDKKLFEVALKEIVSVNAQKGVGNGIDWLIVTYKSGEKEQKIKIMHLGIMTGLGLGILSRLNPPYFSSWEKAIDDERLGRHEGSSNSNPHTGIADELKKLGELLDGGVITQADFENQKRKLLN